MGRNKGLYVFGLLMLLIYWGMAFLLLGSSSVSYTHLDVYKRQALWVFFLKASQ